MALGGLLHLARRPADATLHFRAAIDLYEGKGVLPSLDQARSLLAARAVDTRSTTT